MDNDAYISATAELLRLEIKPEWKPGVAQFLSIAAEMAAVLETVPLDEAELHMAPVFTLPDLPEQTP